MGVTKRPDGSWRAKIYVYGKEKAKHFQRKVDAERWEADQKSALARGDWVDPNNKTTFGAYYEEWAARQVWESGTVRSMSLSVRSTTFLDTPIVKVRRRHVETWVKGMQVAGLAPGTVKTRFSNVRNVLRAAVRDRIIGTEPSVGVVLPRQRRREASINLPTVAQVGAAMDKSHDHFTAFIALGAFAGLRLGEAAALRPSDIDFDNQRIRIDRQIQRTNKSETEVKRPKYGSERTVYMADGLALILADHIKRFETGELAWMFPGEGIYPLHQNSVGYLWRKACRLAGVEGVRFHDLRHLYASSLIEAGCDVVTVQRALGHGSANTTLATYAHWFPSAEDKTRAAAQAMIDTLPGLNRDRDLGKAA